MVSLYAYIQRQYQPKYLISVIWIITTLINITTHKNNTHKPHQYNAQTQSFDTPNNFSHSQNK